MPPVSRPPIFTIASWVAPVVLALLTYGAVRIAEAAGRAQGKYLSGLTPLVYGIAAVAFATFACGLAALLRHERHRWLAILPFLAGLGFFLDLAWQRLH